jgi:hypothetical protein
MNGLSNGQVAGVGGRWTTGYSSIPCLFMLFVNRDVLFYFIYHDAGLRLMLGHLLQNPKSQGPTVFGCGGGAGRYLDIEDS